MIKYQLICDQSHEFEGWFQSSVAYDEQAASGLLCCPICDSDQVKRALMAPNIASAKRRKTAADQSPASETNESARAGPATPDWHEASAGHAATPGRAPVLQAEQVQAYGAALAELRQLRQKSSRIAVMLAIILLKKHANYTTERSKLRASMDRPRRRSAKHSKMRALRYLICRGHRLTIDQAKRWHEIVRVQTNPPLAA